MIRALVIDDNPDVRTIAKVALRLDRGFDVETTDTAREALARLGDDCQVFDAVLLGATTPDMDGALIELIRQRPDCVETPIIFLARRIGAADRLRYHAMGAAGVLGLPFDPITFSRDVTALLESAPH